MLVPIWIGTNRAAGNQQKHPSLRFATKVKIRSDEGLALETSAFESLYGG